MLRKLTALFLIFSILTAGFSRYLVYAGFALNKDYIASTLCENKDKPQLHCSGKCYLTKKLKAAEEKEKNAERSGQKDKYQEAFLNATTKLQIVRRFIKISFALLLPEATLDRSFSIFHPPSFA